MAVIIKLRINEWICESKSFFLMIPGDIMSDVAFAPTLHSETQLFEWLPYEKPTFKKITPMSMDCFAVCLSLFSLVWCSQLTVWVKQSQNLSVVLMHRMGLRGLIRLITCLMNKCQRQDLNWSKFCLGVILLAEVGQLNKIGKSLHPVVEG